MLIVLAIITLTLGIGAGFILFPHRRIEKKLIVPPAIAVKKLIITTCYSTASLDEIELKVTKPLEQVLRGVEGLRNIKSVNSQGTCTMELEFGLEMDMDVVADEIRRLLRRSAKLLPAELDGPPTVEILKHSKARRTGRRLDLAQAWGVEFAARFNSSRA